MHVYRLAYVLRHSNTFHGNFTFYNNGESQQIVKKVIVNNQFEADDIRSQTRTHEHKGLM